MHQEEGVKKGRSGPKKGEAVKRVTSVIFKKL